MTRASSGPFADSEEQTQGHCCKTNSTKMVPDYRMARIRGRPALSTTSHLDVSGGPVGAFLGHRCPGSLGQMRQATRSER